MDSEPINQNTQLPRRFVVLLHRQKAAHHFDLMIDAGQKLATWKMADPPETARDAPQRCLRLPDHRRRYLDYEGPISQNRGEVTRHDAGDCVVHAQSKTCWEVTFHGHRLIGRVHIEAADQSGETWLLRFATA